jgi:hypothetical protein
MALGRLQTARARHAQTAAKVTKPSHIAAIIQQLSNYQRIHGSIWQIARIDQAPGDTA